MNRTSEVTLFLAVDKEYNLVVQNAVHGFPANGGDNTIMRRYILHLFSDGSDELIDLGGAAAIQSAVSSKKNAAPEKKTDTELRDTVYLVASARLFQILQTLSYINAHKNDFKNSDGEPDAENALRTGIKFAAEKNEIPVATVMDKLTRKCGVHIQHWRELVDAWMRSGDFSPIHVFLLAQIEKNANERSREKDKAALDTFKNML